MYLLPLPRPFTQLPNLHAMLLGYPYRDLDYLAAVVRGSTGSDFNDTKRLKCSVMPLIFRAATSHS
jgi:hypothetical protein